MVCSPSDEGADSSYPKFFDRYAAGAGSWGNRLPRWLSRFIEKSDAAQESYRSVPSREPSSRAAAESGPNQRKQKKQGPHGNEQYPG